MKVAFRNSAGLIREVKVGFSWTCLFFGGFPFLFRGMPLHAIFISLISAVPPLLTLLGVGSIGFFSAIALLIIPVKANQITAQYYLEHGYVPVGPGWDYAAQRWGVHLNNSL